MTKQTAVDRAYLWLRERILDNTLPGGIFIDEATVCEATGVSRTPAREAFNRLEGERFITRVPRRGAQVRELNSSDLHEAYHARYMIESYAASEFCTGDGLLPPEMLTNLATMDELTDLGVREQMLRYVDADRSFHTSLVLTLENRPTLDFFDSLWRHNSWAAIHRAQWLRSESWLDSNRMEHHAIVEALQERDPLAASAALRTHLKLSASEYSKLPT